MTLVLVLACMTVLCALQLGQGASHVGTSFTVGNLKFDHVWKTKQRMPSKRSDMTATAVGEEIYLIGGCGEDQVWVPDPPYPEYRCGGTTANAIKGSTIKYVPKSNTFDTSPLDAPRPRYRHAAAEVNKKIYLFGGTGASGNIVKEVDVFDTLTGKWSTMSEHMPNATTDLAAFAHSNKIYILGGYDGSWKAQTSTQVFTPDATVKYQSGPYMAQGRGDTFATLVNNKAYIVGGFHHENNFESPVSSMEMLDMARGASWVKRKAMNVSRGDKAVATVNNILHVVGGESKNAQGHSVPLKDVEAYDPVGDQWYFGGDIPTKRFRFVAATYGSSIYIFGGQGYLVGKYGQIGSKYPLVDTVEEYQESTSQATVSRAERAHFAFVGAVLMVFFFQAHV